MKQHLKRRRAQGPLEPGKRVEPKRVSDIAGPYVLGLAQKAGCPEQLRLVQLWENWQVIMGDEIACLAVPLGHRGNKLVVAAEDNMALQELTYMRSEMLERANAFMEEAFFEAVQLELPLGRAALDADMPERVAAPGPAGDDPKEASLSGEFLAGMDPDSPVARCYRAFLERKRKA